ncbi:MAG TPA: tryptophan synthase subunit alpha [Vicinamibacterales bacterium]|nr:tryptophan synthase subunit alpha [Vicinamibacterales bacterium]
MSARIDATFDRLRAAGRAGLVAYVTAGDPDLRRSAAIVEALESGGADVIELGVPFSDPLADGPVIQRASERALRAGATLERVLALAAEVRPRVRAPLVLFTYANPVVRLGVERFAAAAAEAGIDGVLVVDLPVDEHEAQALRDRLQIRDIASIWLISPTTTVARIARAAELGRGFLYAISRLGVTGPRDRLAADAAEVVGRIRTVTRLPVALGFGISTPEQVAEAARLADAAVVGSALVAVIERHAAAADLPARVAEAVRRLRAGCETAAARVEPR